MPSRLKRYQTEGHLHFLTFSCYHRLPYLNDDRSRTIFSETLETLRRRHQFFLYGYVLMPEHVHLLLNEPKLHPLENTLRALKGQTSKLLKGQRLKFWQARYYDFNVFTQPKFVEKLRYIHRNPVERGLVEKPEDWPWSSFHHWSTGDPGPIEIESHWTFTRRERTPFMTASSSWVGSNSHTATPSHWDTINSIHAQPPKALPYRRSHHFITFSFHHWAGGSLITFVPS